MHSRIQEIKEIKEIHISWSRTLKDDKARSDLVGALICFVKIKQHVVYILTAWLLAESSITLASILRISLLLNGVKLYFIILIK